MNEPISMQSEKEKDTEEDNMSTNKGVNTPYRKCLLLFNQMRMKRYLTLAGLMICGVYVVIFFVRSMMGPESINEIPPLTTSSTRTLSLEVAYSASSHHYHPVPSELELLNVVVITRHGDRAQITKSLKNTTTENMTITNFWKNAMPIDQTFRIMAAAAAITSSNSKPIETGKKNHDELHGLLCTGWDREHSPYAMLTELGAMQLIAVGKELRQRYVGTLLPTDVEDAADAMFCRSTNICRTTQSLRALLAGFIYESSFEHKLFNILSLTLVRSLIC